MTVSVVLTVIAVVLFALAAFGVTFGAVAIIPLGLAFFAAAHLPL